MNKNVLNKLSKIESKVELAEVKVDLALIDDLKQLLDKSKNTYKEFNDSYQKFADFRRLVIIQGDNYSNEANQLMDVYQKAFTQAKELGIDFNTTQIAKDVRSLIANGDPSVIKSTISKLK